MCDLLKCSGVGTIANCQRWRGLSAENPYRIGPDTDQRRTGRTFGRGLFTASSVKSARFHKLLAASRLGSSLQALLVAGPFLHSQQPDPSTG